MQRTAKKSTSVFTTSSSAKGTIPIRTSSSSDSSSYSGSRKTDNIKYFKCNKMGHYASNCTIQNTSVQASTSSNNNNDNKNKGATSKLGSIQVNTKQSATSTATSSDSTIICYFCGKKGHRASECDKKALKR